MWQLPRILLQRELIYTIRTFSVSYCLGYRFEGWSWATPLRPWSSDLGKLRTVEHQHWEINCLNVHQWINKSIYTIYIYIWYVIYNKILLGQKKKKEWNSAICNNVDQPGGHDAKWNKPDRERQILHGITSMWNLKNKINHIQRNRVEWWLPRGERWGKWGCMYPNVQAFNYETNKFWGCKYSMVTTSNNNVVYNWTLLSQ